MARARFRARDAVAGLSVAVVLIPQALAYASLAGMPPVHGLYAAALAPLAAAPFVSSPYLQTGPVAMTSVLTLGALTTLAPPASPEYVALAALLALLVGLFRVVIGVVRAGWLAYLMSQPVMKGFMTAAAVLIVASQVPTLVGLETGDASLFGGAVAALRQPGEWHLASLAVAGATVGLVRWGSIIHPLFPGVLAAVVVGTVGTAVFGFDGPVVGEIPGTFPTVRVDLPLASILPLAVPAAVIALVGFAEAASIARHYAAQDRSGWDPDREFVGQGTANLAAGLVGGFPVGGSFSRTSINRVAGGRSRWTGALTGLVVLLFIPFADVLSGLPRAVLGAVVVTAVWPLAAFGALVRMRRIARIQALVAWATFGATVLLAPRIDLAVVLGVGLAVLVHLWREMGVTVAVKHEDHTLRLQPIGVLFFGSAPGLDRALVRELAAHPTVTRLVIDLHRLGRIDYSGALALRDVVTSAQEAELNVEIARVPRHAVKVLSRSLPEFRIR